MNTETVMLNIKTFHVQPPGHAPKSPCVCDRCWRAYLAWCDRQDDLHRPAA